MWTHPFPLPGLLAALLLLGACAHDGARMERVAITPVAEADPWEKGNRKLFAFNQTADRLAVLPVTNAYRAVVPEAARRGIRNGYDNLQEPTNLTNALLQGKVKRAFRALDRMLVNTVLGLGVADHATAMGLEEQPHDFGQTMAVWGVPSGPYLMLPFFGPSTARDGAGFFVDFILDPVDYLERRLLSRDERWLELGVRAVDIRSGLRDQGDQLLAGSADPYATVRSAWLQLRRYQLFDGMAPVADEVDELPPPPLLPPPLPGDDASPGHR